MAPKKAGAKSARPPSASKPAADGAPVEAPSAAKAAPAKGGKAAPPSKAPPTPVAPATPAKEEPFAPATILLLGGYGTVGSAIARTLLEQSSTAIVLVAGRATEKAATLCKQLNGEFTAKDPRAKPLTADAADSSTLTGCPRFDVLVNATTMRAVEGVITLMRFAASKRASYLDLRGPIGLEAAVAKAVGDVRPAMLMGGGYCPGALAPFLKMAASKLSSCSGAHLSIAATALPSQAEEAIEAMMCGTRLEAWSNGKWSPAKPSDPQFARAVDFGDGKVRHTTPVGVTEVRELPTELSLDTMSVRFASTQDGGLMCAAMAVLCCAPCVGLREGISKHLRAAMERQRALEPKLCACLCEAVGVDKEGKQRKVVLRASHPNGPAAMAAHCAVAQLTQILKNEVAGDMPPRMCGTAIDADKLLLALIKQGVRASIETVDSHDPGYDA